MSVLRVSFAIFGLGLLTACGGGSGNGGIGGIGAGGNGDYRPGVFQPSETFANRCARPRSGVDPATGSAYPDIQGSRTDENNFLRSWTYELYLWYREVPDLNPANYETFDYFDLLRTNALTSSGAYKDRFHFTYDSLEWYQLSQAGVSVGYGAQWLIDIVGQPGAQERRVVVAYTEPDTPATEAGLVRGDRILTVDGANAVTGNDLTTLSNGLFPADGTTHTFRVRKASGAEVTVTMTAEPITSDPVQNVTVLNPGTDPVGYLVFNDHIATAEAELIDAIQTLRAANVRDLVLDIRYNGGGYLAIASQLAYMIAGAQTEGQVFERMVFNDKHPSTNPITGQPLQPTPFYSTTLGFVLQPGARLPTLDLPRVYVITSVNTCSASEAIMNSLSGIGVEVYQIGTRTCGKPYGFYPRDNCGTTYFSIQFQGRNAQDFGDYGDGFKPSNDSSAGGAALPGCMVADDLTRALGDPLEARLAAALGFRASNNQQCPAPSSFAPGAQLKTGEGVTISDGFMIRSPLRENRIMYDM